MKTIKNILKHLKKTRGTVENREISYNKLKELIKEGNDIEIVDVRSPQEYAENKIKFAVNIPLYDIKNRAEEVLRDKNKTIILYCQVGSRSKKAYNILEKMGYTNLYLLKGGIEGI